MYTGIQKFELDPAKARRNALKHGVGFKEAATAFLDPEHLRTEDRLHSHREQRQWLIGESFKGRILIVVFTLRGESARIISARLAGPKERERYEQDRGIPI